jgi:DNA polymerase elongation subunit (family B)
MPREVDILRRYSQREAAKKTGDDVASNAIKILMNSFYGVLGTSACRFYNPALGNSITGTGREILLWSKRWFEAAGGIYNIVHCASRKTSNFQLFIAAFLAIGFASIRWQ